MRNRNAIARQLLAMREQIDAALELLADDPEPCQHKNRDDLTTFGGPERWVCRDCGYRYEGAADG